MSGILFSSSILFFALGSVHWTCVAFDYDSFIANSSALIILFWITFSLSCIQLLSSTLRLVTSLLLMCLMSFDVWYLLSQVCGLIGYVIYRVFMVRNNMNHIVENKYYNSIKLMLLHIHVLSLEYLFVTVFIGFRFGAVWLHLFTFITPILWLLLI